MTRHILIAKEPQVQVCCELAGHRIDTLTLKPSSEGFVLHLPDAPSPALEMLLSWMKLYAKKDPHISFSLPLNWNRLTPFTTAALRYMQTIPLGSTASYEAVAKACNNPKGFRAVGMACKANPFPLVIPCHRIIAKSGKLGGFAYGPEMKQMLLDFETPL